MNTIPRSSRTSQRGVGALVVTLVLLFAASLAALYVNRGVLAEQRTSANQMQATSAHELAEAAIEWATGMLNTSPKIGTDCAESAGGANSFRLRYVLTKYADPVAPSSDVVPATNVFPGCKVDPTTGAMTCHCPSAPNAGSTVASLGDAELPSFTVAFEAVAGDPESVLVTAWACSARAATCTHQAAQAGYFETADGNARVSAILKMRPMMRAVPASPLTCGTSCTVGGSFNIANQDIPTNGVLVNAGTAIVTAPGTTMETLAGQPAGNALIANDASLASLSSTDPTCDNSQMFNAYFGSTIEEYRDAPTTKRLSCGSAADCKAKLDAAYAEKWRAFYFDTDFQLSGNNTYGSQTDPITLVTPNALTINGDNTFYGVIFSNSANWNDIGTGTSNIHGAQVTCAAYNTNGNGTITYDPKALKFGTRIAAQIVRVPGGWRDFRTNADTLP